MGSDSLLPLADSPVVATEIFTFNHFHPILPLGPPFLVDSDSDSVPVVSFPLLSFLPLVYSSLLRLC